MFEVKKFINKLSKFQKIICLFFMFIFVSFSTLFLVIPTLAKPNDNININGQSWNQFIDAESVSTIHLGYATEFSIKSLDAEEMYYLITDEPLTLLELEAETWTAYTTPVDLITEGSYIIYAKFVDEGEPSYANTDLMILNYYNINLDNNTWTNLRSEPNHLYIDGEKTVNIEVVGDLPEIKSIKYYVSNSILNHGDLDSLSSSWSTYTTPITINTIGVYIIYAQIIDNNDKITYINSDYIILDGYTESLTIGRDTSSYLETDPYITNKSTIKLNFNYSNTSSIELLNHTHNLISSIVFPLGTKLTLFDNITENVYEYEISETDNNYINGCAEEKCIYPLTLFKEVGKNNNNLYSEITYFETGITEEDFTIVLDLSNTNITDNFENIKLYMSLYDATSNVRPTLNSTIKKINIYSSISEENANANLYLNTNYGGTSIEFNTNSTTNININSGLSYKYINDFKIIDTTYENKEIGLSVKLVDSEGNIVEKELLKSILFKIDDITYFPEEDNIVRINLNSGIFDVNKTLKITTFENSGILEEGTYYFKISNYISYDGYYYDELGGVELSIPVNVSDNIFNIQYSFGVIMEDQYRIINKADEFSIPFDILQNGELENPNLRISLYKKNQITAYDQNYTLVDLATYVSDALSICENNVYYISTNPIQYIAPEYLYNEFELDLITANFENTGYKFVFELYDDTKKIGTIEKYFIVKGEQNE